MKLRLRMTETQLEQARIILQQDEIPAAKCGIGMDAAVLEQSFSVYGDFYPAAEQTKDGDGLKQLSLIFYSLEESQEEPNPVLFQQYKDMKEIIICFQRGNSLAAYYKDGENIQRIDVITVTGDLIQYFFSSDGDVRWDAGKRTEQLFGKATTNLLRKLKVGVAGVSGTGSIVAEQLLRLGVGSIVVVDDDVIEEKNLNRILNSSYEHASKKRKKVQLFADHVKESGLPVQILPYDGIVSDPEVIHAFSQCDILFGCMDSVDGRHHLNLISAFYSIPYIDVGVKLAADGMGGIDEMTAAVHYVQPGGSSLLSRGVYNSAALYAASLKRENPEEYRSQLQEKYIVGANENSPSVISVNMVAASLGVMEFLSRIHGYRDNESYGKETFRIDLTDMRIIPEEKTQSCPIFRENVGKGDCRPLLDLLQ